MWPTNNDRYALGAFSVLPGQHTGLHPNFPDHDHSVPGCIKFGTLTWQQSVQPAYRAPNMPLIWWPYSSFICTLGLVASQQEYAPYASKQCRELIFNTIVDPPAKEHALQGLYACQA